MNHGERWAACRAVTRRLLDKYTSDVLATGVTGSVGRGVDKEFSDVDFQVLVREGSRLRSHRFILKSCLFSVAARTENDWINELSQPNFSLPLAIGSLKSLRVVYDPQKRFSRLRKRSEKLPRTCWKNAVRAGLEEIAEDLGRVRNAYFSKDWKNFRIYSPHVALEAALVHSSLRQKAVLTENDLLDTDLQEYHSQFKHALLVGIGTAHANNRVILDSLEWMHKTLSRAAKEQQSSPAVLGSISSYAPP